MTTREGETIMDWQPIDTFDLERDEDNIIVTDGNLVWAANYSFYKSVTWERRSDFVQEAKHVNCGTWSAYPRGARDITHWMPLPEPPKVKQ